MTPSARYHAGVAAEDSVARCYGAKGLSVAARRWRGKAGEIDLILNDGDGFVFVEVKKSRDHARAASRVSPAQIRRICLAAQEYLGAASRSLLTPMRFDLATVDAQGTVEIRANAFGEF